MAEQKADTPPSEGQQASAGRGSTRGASSGASSESAQSAQQNKDQERQREVSREPRSSVGSGMQRGNQQQGGAGSSLARGQPSMLPAFMTHPGLMASAFMSDPFAFAQAMSQEMDRLFDTFGGTGQSGRAMSTSGSERGVQQQGGRGQSLWAPQMEVFQRANELVVRADIPGVAPDDVQIDIEDGVLTISGERRQTNEDRQEGFYRSERSYGTFARSIALPEGVDEEQVNARYDHGVLEVTVPMPQQQRQRGRRVQIQSGQSGSQSAGQQSSAAKSADQSSKQGQTGSQPGTGGARASA